MTTIADDLFTEALRLPEGARAAFAWYRERNPQVPNGDGAVEASTIQSFRE